MFGGNTPTCQMLLYKLEARGTVFGSKVSLINLAVHVGQFPVTLKSTTLAWISKSMTQTVEKRDLSLNSRDPGSSSLPAST